MIENFSNDGIKKVSSQFLESLGYTSDNPIFKTEKFRIALIDYRKYGLYTKNVMKTNIDDEIVFIKSRMNIGLKF